MTHHGDLDQLRGGVDKFCAVARHTPAPVTPRASSCCTEERRPPPTSARTAVTVRVLTVKKTKSVYAEFPPGMAPGTRKCGINRHVGHFMTVELRSGYKPRAQFQTGF